MKWTVEVVLVSPATPVGFRFDTTAGKTVKYAGAFEDLHFGCPAANSVALPTIHELILSQQRNVGRRFGEIDLDPG
jgi:hypothetical protein